MPLTVEEAKQASQALFDALDSMSLWIFNASRAFTKGPNKIWLNSALRDLEPLNPDNLKLHENIYNAFKQNPYRELKNKNNGGPLDVYMNDVGNGLNAINRVGSATSFIEALEKSRKAKTASVKKIYKDYAELILSIEMAYNKLLSVGLVKM